MKKIKFIFLIIVILFGSKLMAQQRHSFYFDFFQYYNLYQGSLGLGYDYQLNDTWSFDVSYGYIVEKDPFYPGDFEVGRRNDKGFKVSILPKYFIKTDKEVFFIGSSNYFTLHDYQSYQYQFINGGPDDVISYHVTQKVFGSDIIVGLKPIETGHYFFEASIGIGAKFYWTKNDLDEPLFEFAPYTKGRTVIVPEDNGRHIKLSLPISLKMGFRF